MCPREDGQTIGNATASIGQRLHAYTGRRTGARKYIHKMHAGRSRGRGRDAGWLRQRINEAFWGGREMLEAGKAQPPKPKYGGMAWHGMGWEGISDYMYSRYSIKLAGAGA